MNKKLLISLSIMLYSLSIYAIQPEDFSWLDTCEEHSETSHVTKLPTNVDFVEKWFHKAHEIYIARPCDQPTLEYLTSPTVTTEIRGSLVGMRSLRRDKDCRSRFKNLILQVSNWVDELEAISKTGNCVSLPTQIENIYVVNVSSINVRSEPLTGPNNTKNASIDILKSGHKLTLKTWIIGHNNNKWGKFFYKLGKLHKFGWLNMNYLRPVSP